MRTRRIIALVVAFLGLPFLLLGLIDPLEGGVSLLVAIVLGVAIWALARIPVPKLLWISLVATLAIGALTLAMAALAVDEAAGTGAAMNPILSVVLLVWLWRIGVLVVLAGALVYLVRLFRSLRPAGL